ncbi:MAG TPA: TVP38/TMEM64 family protein [Candidatus Saccharimonadales bacterium]
MKRIPKSKLPLLAIFTIILIAIIAIIIYGRPLWELLSDTEKTRELITAAGPWGPLVFMALQIVQVFVAPIPGQVIGFVGGYLFGTFWGTVYAMVGATIGFTAIFLLARKLGRPFVERFVDQKTLKKFDYLSENNGAFILFLIFLLPALPDDLICFIAGLTNIKIKTLIIISVLGRLPGYLVLSFAGAGVAESNIQLVAIIMSIALAISAVAFWQRRRIERFIKRLGERKE